MAIQVSSISSSLVNAPSDPDSIGKAQSPYGMDGPNTHVEKIGVQATLSTATANYCQYREEAEGDQMTADKVNPLKTAMEQVELAGKCLD